MIAAKAAGFEVMVTTDQEIPYQQNFELRRISVMLLCASTNRLEDLVGLVPTALEALKGIKLGEVLRIA